VEIEFGAARVDQNLSGIVVEKEGKMHALGGDLNPLAASVLTFPFPDQGAEVVAGALGDRSNHGMRTNGEPAEFDHTHGCAANFGNRRVEDEAPTLQQAESR